MDFTYLKCRVSCASTSRHHQIMFLLRGDENWKINGARQVRIVSLGTSLMEDYDHLDEMPLIELLEENEGGEDGDTIGTDNGITTALIFAKF